ncbi:MAG: hypothetical protein M1829_002409 [Trizodia sp. TS-e1964]|nr:MAG: hypothetical protein M1829_002409 [Trizodia sp. TS-e1964]
MSFLESVLASIRGPDYVPPVENKPEPPRPRTTCPELKRKAEEEIQRFLQKALKQSPSSTPSTYKPKERTKLVPRKKMNLSQRLSTTDKIPPKNSFREILQRAERYHETNPQQFGLIKNKPLEAHTKRQRREKLEEARGQSKQTQHRASVKESISTVEKVTNSSIDKAVVKPKPKRLESGYEGTARKGSSQNKRLELTKSSRNGQPSVQVATRGSVRPGSIRSDEMEDSYLSDGSSDMEAPLSYIESEDKRSLKIAREEDARALAEEKRLKREKERKREALKAYEEEEEEEELSPKDKKRKILEAMRARRR